ncbi:hypothetical protein KY361_02015 [Candidatus Woesearchaeota archaeon]|nr:hypothetical protein [Candidatus Woesearchaeota archaeon]
MSEDLTIRADRWDYTVHCSPYSTIDEAVRPIVANDFSKLSVASLVDLKLKDERFRDRTYTGLSIVLFVQTSNGPYAVVYHNPDSYSVYEKGIDDPRLRSTFSDIEQRVYGYLLASKGGNGGLIMSPIDADKLLEFGSRKGNYLASSVVLGDTLPISDKDENVVHRVPLDAKTVSSADSPYHLMLRAVLGPKATSYLNMRAQSSSEIGLWLPNSVMPSPTAYLVTMVGKEVSQQLADIYKHELRQGDIIVHYVSGTEMLAAKPTVKRKTPIPGVPMDLEEFEKGVGGGGKVNNGFDIETIIQQAELPASSVKGASVHAEAEPRYARRRGTQKTLFLRRTGNGNGNGKKGETSGSRVRNARNGRPKTPRRGSKLVS